MTSPITPLPKRGTPNIAQDQSAKRGRAREVESYTNKIIAINENKKAKINGDAQCQKQNASPMSKAEHICNAKNRMPNTNN